MKEPYGPFRTVPEIMFWAVSFRARGGPIAAKKERANPLGLDMAPQNGWLKELWAEDRGDDSVCIPEITARGQPHIVLTQVPPGSGHN